MCTSTNTMKTTPLTAISIFSAIVDRAARAPVTRPVVWPGLGRVVATCAGYRGQRDMSLSATGVTFPAYPGCNTFHSRRGNVQTALWSAAEQ